MMTYRRSGSVVMACGGVIIVALVAIAPTLLIGYSQSDRPRQVTGAGDSLLRFTCPNGQPPPLAAGTTNHVNDVLQFSASQNNMQISGTWTVTSLFDAPEIGFQASTSKGGTITGGKITGNHYSLSGIEAFDGTCGGPIPSGIVIVGKCSTASGRFIQIQFTASNGERGTFTGSAQCS